MACLLFTGCFLVLSSLRADAVQTQSHWQGEGEGKTMAVSTVCSGMLPGQHDAAIVLLVPGPRSKTPDWSNTRTSLSSLKQIQDGGRAEVQIFHDEADHLSNEQLFELFEAAKPRKSCATKLRFAKFPSGITFNSTSPWSKRSKWGYEHMIRFFFVDLFDQSTGFLAGLTYWMRLDSDSFFNAPVPDPLKAFDEDPNLGYIHNTENTDCGIVASGLKAFAGSYAISHNMDPGSIPSLKAQSGCVKGFYNNLELGRISAFQTPDAKEWTQAVADSKGIYTHRWGDALLRRLLIELTKIKTIMISPEMRSSYHHGKR